MKFHWIRKSQGNRRDPAQEALLDDTPLKKGEREVAERLFNDDFTLEEGLRLYHAMVESGRSFPAAWERRVLELGVKAHPDRQDLRDRLRVLQYGSSPAARTAAETQPAEPSAGDLEIVLQAKSRMQEVLTLQAADLPVHGERWHAFADRIRTEIDELISPMDALHFAQRKIGFEHRGDIQHEGKFTELYERELSASFPAFADKIKCFADSEDSDPGTVYEHNGRLISNVLFYLTRIVFSCLTHLPKPPQVILEIGGGYGAPARIWMKNPISPPRCYLIVDMPESLFFADVFLRKEFGDPAVLYVTENTVIKSETLEQHLFILCPLTLHNKIDALPIDLVINTGSLQEMSEDWVDFYRDWLDRQTAKWFYSLNYFAQPIEALWESGNLWSPRLSPAWTARRLRWNPAFIRMQSERNFLEAIYQKDDQQISGDQVWPLVRHLKQRTPCGDNFAELMDIVRKIPEPDFLFEALSYAMRMPFAPKEALWLSESLLRHPVPNHQAGTVKGWHDELVQRRNLGREAYYE